MKIIVFLVIVGLLLDGTEALNPKGNFGDMKNFPYLASVTVDGVHRCGGSIISTSYILTAGHCIYNIKPRQLSVKVGSRSIDGGGEIYDVDKTFIYPFIATKQQLNVGIMHLQRFLRFSDTVQPIHLPRRGQRLPPVGTMALVPGWGKKSVVWTRPSLYMFYTSVPIISHTICKQLYANTIFEVQDAMFCAGLNRVPCGGDSGGPLVIDGIQYGIAGLGACILDNKPQMFYAIPTFRGYIHKITGI